MLEEIRVFEGPPSKLSLMSCQVNHSPKRKNASGADNRTEVLSLDQKLKKKIE